MKIKNKPINWAHEPWTVVTVYLELEGDRPMYYALNTKTGERKMMRYTYDGAVASMPKKHYAEPWGV